MTSIVPGADALPQWADRLARATASWGREVRVDPFELIDQRARSRGLGPTGWAAGGRVSCGGATRLVPCRDGWVAVSLARACDVEAVPAWIALLGAAAPAADLRDALAAADGATIASTAELLGLPVGVLAERAPSPDRGVAVHALPDRPTAGRPERGTRGPIRVVDLSALWAGPLCGAMLARAGAEVVKVESPRRPDGARRGDPAFFRSLNRHKTSRSVDLATEAGRSHLRTLLTGADVVIESSRPRALAQLGLDAESIARPSGRPHVWVSITGHGRASGRVAFGDDAAVAGGLVAHGPGGPCFLGDAIADPLSGIAAATAAAELVAAGRSGLVDVAMAGVAASFAPRRGPT